MKASCSFKTCNAHFIFRIAEKPHDEKHIPVLVIRTVAHLKGEMRSRQASYTKRGKIANEVREGVSNIYYKILSQTPVHELMAGNITRSLTKMFLKLSLVR